GENTGSGVPPPPDASTPASGVPLPTEGHGPKDPPGTLIHPPMDIHPHTPAHEGKQSWRSYFWEFIMLFLAVFLGFLAHYQLEHKIERERERKYIISMVKDLYIDTVKFSQLIRDGQEAMVTIDSMIGILNAPGYQQQAPRLYYMARRLTHIINPYEIFDRTYAAMKTSGNIRLLRHQDVADDIMSYYSDIPTLQSQQQYIFNLLLQYIRDVSDVFDPAVFHQMYHDAGLHPMDTTDASTHRHVFHLPSIPHPAITQDRAAIQKLTGTLHYLYARILSTNSNVRNQQRGAAGLMEILLDAYHLRDELEVPRQ
ncbi:MAG TPA: hypothetical protein VK907_00030, partial [Phnomibacter sp.]|nr:hypothetical protein [Phnomibacter sp.]